MTADLASVQAMTSTGSFCPPPADRIVASNEFAVAIRDGYPVSPGHTLEIPDKADYWSGRS